MSKPSVKESMFTSWMQVNQIYTNAKDLSYTQFVSKFTYIAKKRCWKPRKQGYTIGRLNWVPPSTGELYFLRMMLSISKGPITYEEICIINGIQYPSFREAWFAMGFLQDDSEHIQAIREANSWGFDHYLRRLFVTTLLSNSVSRPEHVWSETWHYLIDGILHDHRRKLNSPGAY